MNKIIFVLLFSFSSFAQDEFIINLDKGIYDVGFKTLLLFDSTRTIHNPSGYRPVQISIWFPAEASYDSISMRYKDYFLLSANEIHFQISKSVEDSIVTDYKNLLLQNGINNDAIDNWFNIQMLACKEGMPLKPKFPLIIVAQGNFHSAHHQSFLCEFLASYGYIVVTNPSQTRITGPLNDKSQAVESADEQVKDMEFTIKSLMNFANIDFNNIALIGHSFGGRSILLLQMKNRNIRCLVSLDGGLGLNTAIEDIKSSTLYNPEKMNVPLLHFYEDSEEFVKPDFSLINGFNNSQRFLIKIKDMKHFYFSSFGFASGIIEGFSPSSQNLADKNKIIFDFTRDFLNSVFSGNNQEMKKLDIEFLSFANKINFISYQYIK
jgi:dienelactone hydrolase